MALTLSAETARSISIDEYLDHIGREVDLRDEASVAESAMMLKALANDRQLVVRRINALVKSAFRGVVSPSAQVIYLGAGKDFFVRANIWPSLADVSTGRVYQDQFSYNLAHDHNYSFMTVGYHGPGYVTEIYEYDHDRLEGWVGEPVEMRFLERKLFTTGNIMLYRASRDLHIQLPPEDLSISLNLMISTPEVQARDQYFFDIDKRMLSGYPAEADSSRRIAIIGMAGTIGNDETRQLLHDLARIHPCRRTRLNAYDSLARLNPEDAESIWEAAANDPAVAVSRIAREQLARLESVRA